MKCETTNVKALISNFSRLTFHVTTDDSRFIKPILLSNTYIKNMKRIIFIAIILMLSVSGFAQADTTKPNEPDTIKVGNFIIIKKDKKTNNYDTTKNFSTPQPFNQSTF